MPDLPPEAWNVIFKSGNGWALILAFVVYRHNEAIAKMKTDYAVLRAKMGLDKKEDGSAD